MKLVMEPTEDSEKSEKNPSPRWDFSEFSVGSISNFISYIILTFAHLGAGPNKDGKSGMMKIAEQV